MLWLGLVGLGLFSALLDMFRTRSPMFDTLQRRNNSQCLLKKEMLIVFVIILAIYIFSIILFFFAIFSSLVQCHTQEHIQSFLLFCVIMQSALGQRRLPSFFPATEPCCNVLALPRQLALV